MTENEIYKILLANGPAGDNQRHNGEPSMIERIARRQAKALVKASEIKATP